MCAGDDSIMPADYEYQMFMPIMRAPCAYLRTLNATDATRGRSRTRLATGSARSRASSAVAAAAAAAPATTAAVAAVLGDVAEASVGDEAGAEGGSVSVPHPSQPVEAAYR